MEGMKIARVEAHLLSYPLPDPRPLTYWGGERRIVKRDAMLIKLTADNGVVGYGPGQPTEENRDAIHNIVRPFLMGTTLADVDALRIRFQSAVQDAAALKAFAQVEIALYDLLGKYLDLPISELLGGRVRERIRLYGSAGMYQPPIAYAEEAAAVADLGFTAYKMRPGLGPDEDVQAVELMRGAAGHALELMVDAHTWWRMGDRNYSLDTVREVAKGMAAHELCWLEEPVLPDQHDTLRQLKALDIAPIASGEHEPDEDAFVDLIDNECVDFVQQDILCQGGYATARRLFPLIAKRGLRFAFHSWGTDLEVIAAAQLGICWPEQVVEWLEYPIYTTAETRSMYPWPLAREILSTPLEIEHGELIVNRRSGLGVDIDESVIERYRWQPGPWSYFKLISPPGEFAVVGDHSIKFA
jgi:L-alanine-DL-glutamate epimerase-like enolase superfamily enzyme